MPSYCRHGIFSLPGRHAGPQNAPLATGDDDVDTPVQGDAAIMVRVGQELTPSDFDDFAGPGVNSEDDEDDEETEELRQDEQAGDGGSQHSRPLEQPVAACPSAVTVDEPADEDIVDAYMKAMANNASAGSAAPSTPPMTVCAAIESCEHCALTR